MLLAVIYVQYFDEVDRWQTPKQGSLLQHACSHHLDFFGLRDGGEVIKFDGILLMVVLADGCVQHPGFVALDFLVDGVLAA